ncbi:sugar nucleotide-binding protein [Cellulophaga baltica]|uniref:sugar nucleotide-binding protein n=1 Tax=Cellulophaga TaxID=104264 RepID=UPI001C066A08|nr:MULTISPECIES: sugar nucleotide-binding protein [Cellulophaga]MBU2994837.1 sugar nucleotide-binding protein [Cellulophaga baltica]MDO6766232.1 sugar nucleotide-binding protein [Cellulophaga sp. 1_MG-2023]
MEKKRILILGASGFIGNAIYKELCNYFNTFGTYNAARRSFESNKQFFKYNLEEDDVFDVLGETKPDIVISALRGNFQEQIIAHQHLVEYVLNKKCKLFFISSANVFDAYSKYPSYEYDKTLSESIYGRLKIKIENMLLRIPKEKMVILRVPMVFGNGSPRVKEMKTNISNNEPVEVFPNLIMNVTNDTKLTQQIHYLISKDKSGIYHLGSNDLVHHDEFINEILKRVGSFNPLFKRVYTTNEERYLAVLPKDNKLPKNYQTTYEEVIEEHVIG